MERRDFIKVGALAVAAAGPFLGKVKGANDRIRVGQIGLGGRGKYEFEVCMQNPGCQIAAVADVYQPFVDLAVRRLEGKADGYADFRRILDRKDIDAVFVSTPDHWHAIVSIMACQAGKHVYCEKPLSHTIEEGRRMVDAARRYNRIFQTGSQQRSAPHYAKIVELIRNGYIGSVAMVECWNMMNEFPEGQGSPADSDPPPGLNWDMFLGPAPKRPYNPNRFLYTFRQFWDYAGSMMADWGAHHMDIIHWAMGVDAPKNVTAVGGKFVMKDDRETPDTFMGDFEYPGFTARYTYRYTNSQPLFDRPYGIAFYGTLGTLVVDRSSYAVYPELRPETYHTTQDFIGNYTTSWEEALPHPNAKPRTPPLRQVAGPRRPLCVSMEETGISIDPSSQIAHVQNFFDCIRSGQRPAADVEIGYKTITACHLGVIAYKTKRTIHWDAQRERITGDEEAQKLTSKEYRSPWLLPAV